MPVPKFTVTLVHADLTVVNFHVLHESSPVLQRLLDHTEPDNKCQRGDHADGGEGAHRGEGEDGGEEEVEVGHTAELLEDGLGEESEDVVLGGGDVVGGVLERLPAVEDRVVAVDDTREPRPADGAAVRGGGAGSLVCGRGAEAGEGVELAPSQPVALPPAGTGHLGSRLWTPIPATRRPALAFLDQISGVSEGIPVPSGQIRPGREGEARRRVRLAFRRPSDPSTGFSRGGRRCGGGGELALGIGGRSEKGGHNRERGGGRLERERGER